MKTGETYYATIETGNGLKTVRATVIEILDSRFCRIEFPHPTVRHMRASRVIARASLRVEQ